MHSWWSPDTSEEGREGGGGTNGTEIVVDSDDIKDGVAHLAEVDLRPVSTEARLVRVVEVVERGKEYEGPAAGRRLRGVSS